jgi:acetyl-CoA carboxylase biotin carboxyl carrier protein
MDFKAIQELLRFVNKSDLNEVELEQGDFKLRIKRKTGEAPGVYYVENPQPVAPALPAAAPALQAPAHHAPAAPKTEAPKADAASAPSGNQHVIKSPMIGTFYRSSSPDKPSFVKVGDKIKPGQTLCIIEAMKLFNEIEGEVEGTIVKIMVENAQPVEYDQPLFLVELDK